MSFLPAWLRTPTGIVALLVIGLMASRHAGSSSPPSASVGATDDVAGVRAGGTGQSADVEQETSAQQRAHRAAAARLLAMSERGEPIERQRHALGRAVAAQDISPAVVAALLRHTKAGITLGERGTGGSSRLGGAGVLPAGADWPHGADSRPMTFIALIDLARLPHLAPLPSAGTLMFFLDQQSLSLDPYATSTVLWAPPGAQLRQAEPGGDTQVLHAVPLRGLAMPIAGEPEAIDQETGQAGVGEQQRLFDTMNDMADTLYRHQLLGSSRDVQGPVLQEVAYWFKETASPASRSHFSIAELAGRGWTLLAEFDEDPDADLTLADGGSLFYVIPTADLRARRFDRTLAIVQSH